MAEVQWYFAVGNARQGPVPESELVRLIGSGQVPPTAAVWRDGMAGWQQASQVPELAAAAGRAPAPPPVPLVPLPPGGHGMSAVPGMGAVPAQPLAYGGYAPYPPGPQSPVGQDPGVRWLIPVGRSGWAIAAGYLGLFSVLLVPAPLALLFAILAIVDIKKHPERHGMGRAIFGLIMGILGSIFLCFMLIGLAARH